MASRSESAAEKVSRWAVSPTEDVVQALMETLVDPLLPLGVTRLPPSEDVQIAVAKKMHAVVLLYNYYHRKQKPELVFLEFLKFCKLAIVIRPPLIAFMKMMKECEPEDLSYAEDWLSVTEKAIRDACDIALGLDASEDVPNIEEWPISKVAVLLIDLKKKNCVLQFGAVTKGAWSLIEKELNESTSTTQEISAGKEAGNKRKRDNLKVSTYNTEFLQLGYDAVKDLTGSCSSELKVLETHMTYSLSKEKSATCFYIMQCPGPFNEHKQVPLSILLESLQGPLVEKLANGLWKATPSVKSHHMLPYVELILCWLSGYEMKENSCEEKITLEKGCDLGDRATEVAGRITLEKRETESSQYRQLLGKTVDDNAREKFNEKHDVEHSAKEDDRRAYPEILDVDTVGCGKDILSGPPRVLTTTHENNLTNICTASEDNKILNPKLKIYHYRRKKKSSMRNAEQLREALSDLKVEADALMSNQTQRSDEKEAELEGYLTNTFNRTGASSAGDQQAQLEAEIKPNVDVLAISAFNQLQIEAKLKNNLGGPPISAPDHVQNALALLYTKRQELYSQICNMEDALALCEDNVSRIRDGGEVDLARECIKSVISGKLHLLLENGTQVQDNGNQQDESQHGKHNILSEAYLPGMSSCQDLEYTCLRNEWRLPRYLTETSEGKFSSTVVVEGKDFKLNARGGLESKPSAARESAAAKMIAVMHKAFP